MRLFPGERRLEVSYRLASRAASPLDFYFGVEWIINLLAGRAPDRYVRVDGVPPEDPALAAKATHVGAVLVSLIDEWMKERVDLRAPGAAGWVRAPIETVSLSESGVERVFQGTALMPYWKVRLEPGADRGYGLTLELRHGEEIGEWTAV